MYRFVNWPLRTKLAALLVVTSLLPLAVASSLSVSIARKELLEKTEALLVARSDQLMGRIDTFVTGYQRAVNRMAQVPTALEMLQADEAQRARLQPGLRAHLGTWPATDPGLRGVAVLDAKGTVLAATEAPLIGMNLNYRSFVREALLGKAVISDVYVAEPEVGGAPTIAFLAPMQDGHAKLIGIAAFWVRAAALTDVLKESNDLAGPGSHAILFDHLGIRIAHSFSQELVFHPGIRLSPANVEALVTERRFGPQTRDLVADVRPVSTEFQLAAAQPPHEMFRGYAPGNGQWNYVIARRFSTVDLTSYYLSPEGVLNAQIATMIRQQLLLVSAIVLMTLIGSALFAAVFLAPIRQLSSAARDIAGGDLGSRVPAGRRDELGQLGATFNNMAERLEQHSVAQRQESDTQYRSLFDALTEGFCTVEMIYDAQGSPVDFRFLNANPAFQVHSGLDDPAGKTIREIAPDMEGYWFEIFGRVAQTGIPVQFENEAKALGRYYEVSAYQVGGRGSNKVAVVFSDISGRKATERRREAQLERLNLLQRITRAIGDRQDLASIHQVVITTLEDHLPIDFGCICVYEP
ncbi:MAG: HAMP domain-containing protein, partial [Steroidobacteraceae bacterium]